METTLFHYWRSSCSWRVRWALEIKKIKTKYVHVSLLNDESESEPHLSRNPLGQVPAFYFEGKTFIESMPIIEMLEERFPENSIFPKEIFDRTHVRTLCEIINSGTQPIQNLPVLDYFSKSDAERKKWNQHFIGRGLNAYEKLVSKSVGRFSFGDQITAADLFLIPQCYNAIRNEMDLGVFPNIQRIHANALSTKEAQNSAPERFEPK